MGTCNSKCGCCQVHKIHEFWFDEVEGDVVDARGERRYTATQLLCQTVLYWLIRYCIQNPDHILEALFPDIHEQVKPETQENDIRYDLFVQKLI
ncbi:U exon [Siadenovirus carbocapituli]|uniref:U exon n=1 Tax=Siadenovirus sp. TaxID=2671519 RepID=A0A9E7QYC7_9ADEN|nr:U exon [Siadenovirus sp.]